MKLKNFLICEANEKAIQFIMQVLTNDENSTDAELILHIAKETHTPIAKASKLVKSERNRFLQGELMSDNEAKALIKKYI